MKFAIYMAVVLAIMFFSSASFVECIQDKIELNVTKKLFSDTMNALTIDLDK